MTYAEKLLDPRWQKRRLEIFQRADFKCESCSPYEHCFPDDYKEAHKNEQLHIHHRIYRKGKDPWDYPDNELLCLCKTCHQEFEKDRLIINEFLAKIDGYEIGTIAGAIVDAIKTGLDETKIAEAIRHGIYLFASGKLDAENAGLNGGEK